MPLPPLAISDDLEKRVGIEFTTTDEVRAEAILDDVSALARRAARQTWETGECPDDVFATVLSASRRLFVNPNGFASEQDGDYSYRLPGDIVEAGVFTEAETDVLESYRPTSGLWALQITGGDDLDELEFERRWLESFPS